MALQRYIQVINLEYRGKRNAYFDLQFFQIDIVPQIQLEANSLLSRNQKKLEKKGQINTIHQKNISKNMTKIEMKKCLIVLNTNMRNSKLKIKDYS